ncbi:hypothetical protein GT347_22340 [Xylophilus rhododendri]|uniref:Uncharacterized protein n=1 Tax=Xylophilus rhododendri TaxID=2697032 RepID=A0A857JBZ0_9BURK|nr:hypothetical protein [Xylophilus rhododendri]QHJ00473.1 hypothetical protein GT347_22340 [Xylophilus rhododendri]
MGQLRLPTLVISDSIKSHLPPGGGPPDNADMDARVQKLENLAEKTGEKLTAIETRLTKIETRADYFATRADVSEAKTSIILWVVGSAFLTQVLPALPGLVKGVAAVWLGR